MSVFRNPFPYSKPNLQSIMYYLTTTAHFLPVSFSILYYFVLFLAMRIRAHVQKNTEKRNGRIFFESFDWNESKPMKILYHLNITVYFLPVFFSILFYGNVNKNFKESSLNLYFTAILTYENTILFKCTRIFTTCILYCFFIVSS